MSENFINVEVRGPNKNIRFQLEALIGAAEGFRVMPPEEKRQADLLVMELGENPDSDFRAIEALSQSGTDVFVTAGQADQGLLLRIFRSGAAEFFPQPIAPKEVGRALLKLRDKTLRISGKPTVRHGRILHLLGCKGGVGTTTIAVNLAAVLAQTSRDPSVCLIDMNMAFGEIPLFLDLKPAYTWGEILKNMERLDATYLMNIIARHPSGVHLLAAPNAINGYVADAGEKFGSMIGFVQKMFDHVVIDTGQAVNDTTRRVFDMADDALLVSILTFPALANTSRMLKSLNSHGSGGGERARILVNRYLKKSEISLEDAEKSLSSKIYWTLPNDYRSTMSAINQGRPLMDIAPRAPLTRNIYDLAARLYGTEKPAGKTRWRIFGKP